MLKVEANDMRNIILVEGTYYHIFNRAVDRQLLFKSEDDFLRFYISLCLFNDTKFESDPHATRLDLPQALEAMKNDKRDQLVHVINFILMPNHPHLFLKQRKKDGVSRFLHRVEMAYSHYFNKKYGRTGRLFESPYKAVMARNDAQFYHLPRYIHLNALDLSGLPWREGKISDYDWPRAVRFLDNYKWSSHHVYCGRKQLLPVVDEKIAKQLFSSPIKYWKYLKEWSGREVPDPPFDSQGFIHPSRH